MAWEKQCPPLSRVMSGTRWELGDLAAMEEGTEAASSGSGRALKAARSLVRGKGRVSAWLSMCQLGTAEYVGRALAGVD